MASHLVPAETVNSPQEQGERVGAPSPHRCSQACPTGQRPGLKSFPGGRSAGWWCNSSAGMKMSVPVHRSGRPYRNGVQRVGLLQLPAGISWQETPIALGCSAWRTSLAVRHLVRGLGLGLLHPWGSSIPGAAANPTLPGLRPMPELTPVCPWIKSPTAPHRRSLPQRVTGDMR